MRAAVLDELAARILTVAQPGRRTLVGIDGVDGSGKTTLADELATRFGDRAARLSIDGFHNPRELRYRRGRDDPEGFFRDSYDYEAFLGQALGPLIAGEPRYIAAVYDVERERPVSGVEAGAATDAVVLVDGIFLHRDELVAVWDWSLWLEVPFAVSIPRGAARGPGFGSPDPDDPRNRRYVDGQRLYIRECDPAARATVVVDNSDLGRPQILR